MPRTVLPVVPRRLPASLAEDTADPSKRRSAVWPASTMR